jgi:hypothetical protein
LWRDAVAATRRNKGAWSSLGIGLSLGDILGDSLGDILGDSLGDTLLNPKFSPLKVLRVKSQHATLWLAY